MLEQFSLIEIHQRVVLAQGVIYTVLPKDKCLYVQGLFIHSFSNVLFLQLHNNSLQFEGCLLIPSPNLLVLVTCERLLPARGTFRAILASESH
jgi:hypothetical protein